MFPAPLINYSPKTTNPNPVFCDAFNFLSARNPTELRLPTPSSVGDPVVLVFLLECHTSPYLCCSFITLC